MSLPVVLSPEAEDELTEAVDWYEQQASRGADFLARVQGTLARIGNLPQLYPVAYRDIRRGKVPRYPYSIFYRVHDDHVDVLAVFHDRRSPSDWQSRA